jgi:phage minor structural protein
LKQYNTLGTVQFNSLGDTQFNEGTSELQLQQLVTRLGARPIVLDMNMNQVAILDNCIEAKIEQEVAGVDEITFTLPMNDKKRDLIVNEGYIQMFDTIYVIREVIDRKKARETEVFAEAIWYDLQYAEPLSTTKWSEVQATAMLSGILNGTGWKVGTVAIATKRTLEITEVDVNRLEALRKVESLYNGELHFDTQAKKVNLLTPVGTFTGASIQYEKNAEDIEAHYDTKDMITKLYVYGKNNLSIADVNGGKAYVENYTYTSQKRVRIMSDERYTNPYVLLDVATDALDYLAKPRASYKVKMAEVVNQTKLPHEKLFIGGTVRMYDKEINLDVETRIMSWTYNVIEPWRTELNLETKAKTLSDLLSGVDNAGDTATSAEAVDKAEMLSLAVFNYLLNSRADDGFKYWTQYGGWVVDPVNGSSGSASFSADGALGVEKKLEQTVRPSTQENYAISFKTQADITTKGDNAKVGIEVVVNYEDGTSDAPKFISLI